MRREWADGPLTSCAPLYGRSTQPGVMERIGRLRQVDRLIRFAVQPVLAHVADDPHDGQPRAGFLLRTQPVFHVQPMDGYVAPGIYGVISCTVGLRTREMGNPNGVGSRAWRHPDDGP